MVLLLLALVHWCIGTGLAAVYPGILSHIYL